MIEFELMNLFHLDYLDSIIFIFFNPAIISHVIPSPLHLLLPQLAYTTPMILLSFPTIPLHLHHEHSNYALNFAHLRNGYDLCYPYFSAVSSFYDFPYMPWNVTYLLHQSILILLIPISFITPCSIRSSYSTLPVSPSTSIS